MAASAAACVLSGPASLLVATPAPSSAAVAASRASPMARSTSFRALAYSGRRGGDSRSCRQQEAWVCQWGLVP